MPSHTNTGRHYYYFSTTNGKMAVNVTRIVALDCVDSSAAGYLTKNTELTFGADGKMVINCGPVGGYFYDENGFMLHGWKLYEYNGEYYYVATNNMYITNKEVYLSKADLESVGLNLPGGYYEFDAEGKMILQ